MRLLFNISFAKFGGATGNYNAHHAYPQIDWLNNLGHFVAENLVYTIHFNNLKLSITIILLHLDALKE
jgi:hypothetical protein